MSLKATLQKAIDKGLLKLDDLRSDIIYHSVSSSALTYDPITNVTTQVTPTVFTFKAVLTRPDHTEVTTLNLPVDKITQKIIVSSTDLTAAISLGDYVDIAGTIWNVSRFKGVPGDSIRIVYICEP